MAGAGYKLFNTGDVLTAQQVNEYLQQQTVMVFASAAARTTALSGVLAEGMVSYLKDTNLTEVYDGSAWVAIGADQTPLTTKGDLFTYSTQDARLGVGTNGQYLIADSTTATGLKWGDVSAGAYTQLATGSLSGSSTNISSISQSYRDLYLIVTGFYNSAADGLYIRFNSSSTGYELARMRSNSTTIDNTSNGTSFFVNPLTASGDVGQQMVMTLYNYTTSSYYKSVNFATAGTNNSSFISYFFNGMWRASKNAITSIQILTDTATAWGGGTYTLLGVK